MRCSACGRSDVRLYRPYGEFLREERIRCNAHVPPPGDWWYPCIVAIDGSVWGTFAEAPEATADRTLWLAMKEADPAGFSREAFVRGH